MWEENFFVYLVFNVQLSYSLLYASKGLNPWEWLPTNSSSEYHLWINIKVARVKEMIDNWRGSWTFYKSNSPCSYNKNRVEKNVENMPPDVSVLRVKLSRKRRGMWAATHLITCLCVVPFNCIPFSDWVKFLIHARKNHRVILPFIQGMEEAVASVVTVAMVAALAGDVDKNVALT